ncbi:hypothetical protein NQ318_012279 [Aromia moschata]|uniref:Uncharacterized protein n=1 Tax=Aromia moschata TaxID=1265417 RepID=A0AAV8YIF1_9CUCU|nr:hypothetical protein NQ318_012279 [Aromia moschata]
MRLNADSFLSNESLVSSVKSSEQRMSRSVGSAESLPKGAIMNAVVSWLQKSSPFSSTDNIDHQSVTTSIPDTMDVSMSIFDEEDLLEHFDEKSKSEQIIPDILISEDDVIPSGKLSCDQLTEAATPLTPTETKKIPQPKPRSAKTPEMPLQFSPRGETKPEKTISPVRDDLLDKDDIPESYSDKKKFWESVTKEGSSKRLSFQETTIEKDVPLKQRTSVHELGAPPIPKPRTTLQSSQSLINEIDIEEASIRPKTSILQSSKSVMEVEMREESRKVSVKDRAKSFESTGLEISESLPSDLTKIPESSDSPEGKMLSEYQASFQPPTERKPILLKEDDKVQHKTEFTKTDSLDSDVAQKGSSQFIENSGYISDSEDVEHYISDSEIEDRVPQIRDRLMSVFIPSASSGRKSIYERSASLPTEDMYEVSARNIKLRKEYYEEQIRKEMIEEQLTSEIEEEPSPEKKALLSSTEEEYTDADAKSIAEDIEDIVSESVKESGKYETESERKASSVRSLAKSFEEKISTVTKEPHPEVSFDKYSDESFEEKHQKEDITHEKTSVKDLARGYEKQLGDVIAGQRIGQMPAELKGFVLEKHKYDNDGSKEESQSDLEVDLIKDETHKLDSLTHKTEDQFSVSIFTHSETHKETEIDSQPKTFESQQSISSDKSAELLDEQKEDSHSTKPDSMEVLVDKSEIEDTEKLTELDQDYEAKSVDSLEAESSPKSNLVEDGIPEIRFTLSGEQRRISEESDDYIVKPEITESSSVTQKSEVESPIRLPKEYVQDTVWEVSVESHPVKFDERAEDILDQKSFEITEGYIATEKIVKDKFASKDFEVDKTVFPETDATSRYEDDLTIKKQGQTIEKSEIKDSERFSTQYEKQVVREETTHKEYETLIKKDSETKEHVKTVNVDVGSTKTKTDTETYSKPEKVLEDKDTLRSTMYHQLIKQEVKKELDQNIDDLSADILEKFIMEEKKIAEKIAKDDDKDLQEIAREERQFETLAKDKAREVPPVGKVSDDTELMIDEQKNISEQLEAKLKEKSTEPSLVSDEKEIEMRVLDGKVIMLQHQVLRDDDEKIEKEDDLSSSAHDESDLGSEIHQDHSCSSESDRVRSDSHSDIEKIILDSLHHQKVHPEEAKKIASALIEEIEAEIQRRESLDVELVDRPIPSIGKLQVSEFLRHLAETKGLDQREVELVQSVLARKQRGTSKLTRGDTQASSMEITDEDLRYSGTEMDYSHLLEQQMDQLEAEKIKDVDRDFDRFNYEQAKRFQDKSGYVDKIDEVHTEESETSHDFESYEDSKIMSVKKDFTIKTTDTVKGEKSVSEVKEVISKDSETISESAVTGSEKLITHVDTTMKEVSQVKSNEKEIKESKTGTLKAVIDHSSEAIIEKTEVKGENLLQEKSSEKTFDHDISTISAKFEEDLKAREFEKDSVKDTHTKKESEYDEVLKKGEEISKVETTQYKTVDGSEIETKLSVDKKHQVTTSTVTEKDHVQGKTVSVSSKILDSVEDLEKLVPGGKLQASREQLDETIPETTEVIITTHEVVKRTSSSESKSSTEAKSPEDQLSSASSGKKEPDVAKTSEKDKVIFRKPKSDADTSSSSSNLKLERKSGVEFEAYSSSGESHYHSFEMDSGKSRPCSSDVEGLVAAGSSEYESALTSQEYSTKSHITSTEYHTAASSMSSKESMKSLDSESSGNLASVEVSEHSETLVPSTSDVEDILDAADQQLFDDVDQTSAWTSQSVPIRQSTEVSDSELISYTVGESMEVSEEESPDLKVTDIQSRMKRSQEMTFQPEPKILVPESPQDFEERLGTSLDEGSVLSVSVSSTSSTGAQRTVIELSRADSERLEGSMTVSATSEHLSLDEVENTSRGSRESLIYTPATHVTTDTSTSTPQFPSDLPIESVTITTSTIDEDGIQSVSTQVTSETQSPVEETVEEISFASKPEYEPKKKGHRRTESTSFAPSIVSVSSATRAEIEKRLHSELAESDKYSAKLSFKETSSDEKKDIDESEKEESYETEADQGFHRDLKEGRYFDTESDNEGDNFDLSRPQSVFSKSDSERDRPTSTGLSDDRPDSELADLIKSSDVTEVTDPIERPASPEPCDETKYDTPEFSSEAQASVGELEQEYSSAVSRSHEVQVAERRQSFSTISELPKIPLEKRDSHGKSSTTSSEKSSFEEAEAEAAFNMVAHVSPAHKIKQICPIMEDEDAEKHELETRERTQKEFGERRSQLLKDSSPGYVPDIKITQHMTPLVDRNFRYPELELEAKEKEHEVQIGVDTPQTPASNSSKSSEDTDQGREYVLDETVPSIPEEPECMAEDKVMTESRSEGGTVIEATVREDSEKGTDSPNSDSFEMLEKPDLIDDFVVIEEVGKEAQEYDSEGKSVRIGHMQKKSKKHDEEVEQYLAHSAPTPLTRMTDMKYYPDGNSSSEELGFDFEDSPPQMDQKGAGGTSKIGTTDYGHQYDKELEANRKWIEQQFQGDQAAMMAAGYGYEMEFERGPLEDIKEEDINDFAASSYGSQRESGGSLKDSYSSTPEYDVLAGRKYFTRSGEHDDISMSSLQEFEKLEQAMSLEMRKFHQGSQDSSSNGSFKTRYITSKGGQGDDISVSSLKEFEGLEKACIAAHKIEVKVKEEEDMLAQIEEGQESIASESESCETASGTEKKLIPDTDDEEDYEKRMFEIDEIIRQAQSNVERFVDFKEMEKTESLGRGDSVEEVSKVPDLELDTPIVKSTIKVQWKEGDDIMITSTDSLDLKEKPSQHDSTDSLDQKTGGDIMTASTDSIEFQAHKSAKDNIMTDSIEVRGDDKSYMVSSDSLELGAATSSGNNVLLSDSIDEDGSRIGAYDQSTSSTGRDFSSSAKEEDIVDPDEKGDFMLESIESLDPTSSTATHATYQYDTDSIYSGSFTSGGSNTMVSSTTSMDQARLGTTVDVAAAVRKVWFDEDSTGLRTTEYVADSSKPYVTEVIEPLDDDQYSHTIHRRVELPPEVRKITFTGDDADEQMRRFIQDFNEGEDVQESEEVDEDGNVHVRKVVQRRFIVKSDESGADQPMTGTQIEDYFKQLNQPDLVQGQSVITRTITDGHGVISKTISDGQGSKTTITQQFDIPHSQLTTLTGSVTGEEASASVVREPPPPVRVSLRLASSHIWIDVNCELGQISSGLSNSDAIAAGQALGIKCTNMMLSVSVAQKRLCCGRVRKAVDRHRCCEVQHGCAPVPSAHVGEAWISSSQRLDGIIWSGIRSADDGVLESPQVVSVSIIKH